MTASSCFEWLQRRSHRDRNRCCLQQLAKEELFDNDDGRLSHPADRSKRDLLGARSAPPSLRVDVNTHIHHSRANLATRPTFEAITGDIGGIRRERAFDREVI